MVPASTSGIIMFIIFTIFTQAPCSTISTEEQDGSDLSTEISSILLWNTTIPTFTTQSSSSESAFEKATNLTELASRLLQSLSLQFNESTIQCSFVITPEIDSCHLKIGNQTKFLEPNGTFYLFEDVSPGTQYPLVISCGENATQNGSICFPPKAPDYVKLLSNESGVFEVEIDEDDSTGVDRYEIVIAEVGENCTVPHKPSRTFHCNFGNLLPATEYRIDISAFMAGACSNTHSTTQRKLWTQPEKPVIKSQKSPSPGSVEVALVETSLDIYYRVKAINASSAICIQKSICILRDLEPGRRHRLEIQACFKPLKDEEEICGSSVATTIQVMPPPFRGEIHVVARTPDSIVVALSNPRELQGYRVSLRPNTGENRALLCDLQNTECSFHNLQSCTEYQLIIGSYSDDYWVPEIHRTIKTSPTAPTLVNVFNVTENAVEVEWTLVGWSGREKIYITANSTSEASFGEVLECKSSPCLISQLKPNTQYTIEAFSTCGADERSSSSISKTVRTLRTANFALIVVMVVLGIVVVLLLLIVIISISVIKKGSRHSNKHLQQFDSLSGNGGPLTIDYFEAPRPYTMVEEIYPPVKLSEFRAYTARIRSQNDFSKIFENITRLSKEQEKHLKLTTDAAQRITTRNRYADILPYDQSLVTIGRPWPITISDPKPKVINEQLSKAYVNASYIRKPLYSANGAAIPGDYESLPEFIATQGPKLNTAADFLVMLYEQSVATVFMLCNCHENGKDKCSRYWPEGSHRGSLETFTSTSHVVTAILKEFREELFYTLRVFTIRPHSERDPWTVTHIHVTIWLDKQPPKMETFYQMLVIYNEQLQKHPLGIFGPPVVHCSAGVGRTGTFICGCLLLERLRQDPSKIDIPGTILAIRRWRKLLVQVPVQLEFIYDFMQYVIERDNITVRP